MTSTRSAAATGLPAPFHDDPGDSRSLAALVSAAAQPAPAHPDAALLDLGRRWTAIQQQFADLDSSGATLSLDTYLAEADVISAQQAAIGEAAASIPAATFAGLAVKARILAGAADCSASDDPGIIAWAFEIASVSPQLDQAVGSLVADLLRLAQEAGR